MLDATPAKMESSMKLVQDAISFCRFCKTVVTRCSIASSSVRISFRSLSNASGFASATVVGVEMRKGSSEAFAALLADGGLGRPLERDLALFFVAVERRCFGGEDCGSGNTRNVRFDDGLQFQYTERHRRTVLVL